MSVVESRYTVEGWGVGELWTRGGLVVAHWFDFGDADPGGGPCVTGDGPGAAEKAGAALVGGAASGPPRGAHGPPGSTLAAESRRVGHVFVPRAERLATIAPADPTAAADPAVLVERVRAYLAGAAVGFDDVELDLEACTPFQRAATEALRAIPRGEVVTYGELAALAGHPGAPRAAGTFCAGNRFALVVPCHRVVAADGIGGYGATGVAVKRRLLALEGVRA